MAATRSLLLVAAFCAFQMSHAGLLPTWDSLESTVNALKTKTEAALNSTLSNITSQVNAVASTLESNLTTTISLATTEVTKLVSDAEADGVAAGSCGVAAAANLTDIGLAFPLSIAHCYTDYLDAFDYYVDNIENDFSQIFGAIKYGIEEASECGILDVACDWNAFYNTTKFEVLTAGDIAFQLADSTTAAVNLVATILKCDEEKSSQALLDVAEVVPDTIVCIAGIKAASNDTSS